MNDWTKEDYETDEEREDYLMNEAQNTLPEQDRPPTDNERELFNRSLGLLKEIDRLKEEIRIHWRMRGEQMERICKVEEQNRIMRKGIAEIIGTWDNHEVTARDLAQVAIKTQALAEKGAKDE